MTLVRHDYAFPFRIDLGSGRTAESAYAAHVEQMVRQVLLTAPGERADVPAFGCGLRALVFAPLSDALAATIKLRVMQGLGQWLAGVVEVVDVVVADGVDTAAPGRLEVRVTYTLVETRAAGTVTVAVT